jgi:Coenzyme PQQ synthesis protein D (PqqD)
MIELTQRFDISNKDVAAKVMDGEAVIINLSSGVYYSMDKVGALLWDLIQSGHSLEQCVDAIASRYSADRCQVQADAERLVLELLEEDLIIPADRETAGAMDSPPLQCPPYESPQLNIYRDMGDLLALDPPTPGLQISPWGTPEADEVPS